MAGSKRKMTHYTSHVLKKREKRAGSKGALKYHYMHDFGGQPWRLGEERMQ